MDRLIPDNLVPLVINDVRNKRQAREGSEVYGVKRKRVVYSIPGQFAPLVINDTQEEEEEEGGCWEKRITPGLHSAACSMRWRSTISGSRGCMNSLPEDRV